MTTWKEMIQHTSHLTAAQREMVRRLTAPARHRARVDQARAAARGWLERHGHQDTSMTISLLCWAQGRGVSGGGLKAPGAGITRHPAFQECGKGRAWTAAIAEAGWQIGISPEGPLLWFPGEGQEGKVILPEQLGQLLSKAEMSVLAAGLIQAIPTAAMVQTWGPHLQAPQQGEDNVRDD